MRIRFSNWLIPLLLLGTAAYALAEELTLTTYYPSPRGVYSELRVNGNLGIGTMDPATKLHLDSDGTDAYLLTLQRGTSDPWMKFRGRSTDDAAGITWRNNSDTASNAHIYYQTNGLRFESGNMLALALKNDGKVGIGTASPGGNLEIFQAEPGPLVRMMRHSSGYGVSLKVRGSPENNEYLDIGAAHGTGGPEDRVAMSIGNGQAGVRVGIGTTSPDMALTVGTNDGGDKLHVNGNIIITAGGANCRLRADSSCDSGYTPIGSNNGLVLCMKCGPTANP